VALVGVEKTEKRTRTKGFKITRYSTCASRKQHADSKRAKKKSGKKQNKQQSTSKSSCGGLKIEITRAVGNWSIEEVHDLFDNLYFTCPASAGEWQVRTIDVYPKLVHRLRQTDVVEKMREKGPPLTIGAARNLYQLLRKSTRQLQQRYFETAKKTPKRQREIALNGIRVEFRIDIDPKSDVIEFFRAFEGRRNSLLELFLSDDDEDLQSVYVFHHLSCALRTVFHSIALRIVDHYVH